MAEFQSLANIKNVILAPLVKVRPAILAEPTQIPAAPVIATSVVTRHDHHNIEIKTVSDLSASASLVETDIYLFVPRSFELRSVGKADLLKDFRSRMRLALPVQGEQGATALAAGIRSVKSSIMRLESSEAYGETVSGLNHPTCDQLLEATKDLCAVIAETLKHGAATHTRQYFLSHTLLATPGTCTHGLETLALQVNSMHQMVERVRESIHTNSSAAANVLGIFDEYISQLYVQYLGTIRGEFAKIGTPKAVADALEYESARSKLESLLNHLQEKEAAHRVKFGGPSPEKESDLDREKRLVRLSQLKKFFQSKTFIDISREQAAKKVSESTAAAGTAAAGIFAALLERFSRPEVVDVAFQGLFVLSFGVIVYVLRDRLKDWAKAAFHEKALKFLPDFQQQLMAKEKKIGVVKEWFSILSRSSLPSEIRSLRDSASENEMEKWIPEDIFLCRKIQKVHSALLATSGHLQHSKSLHEYVRVNFERYLKHMDDPFKDFTDLDPSGRFLQSRSHRVYHFYLCVKTMTRPFEPRLLKKLGRKQPLTAPLEQTLLYRVVLDKNGVVRLENLKKAGA